MIRKGRTALTLTFNAEEQTDFPFLLASDLHIGHPKFNLPLFHSQFTWAKENDARILILGDLMDMILPGDRKRSTPSAHTLGSADDTIDRYIDAAFNTLSPYAALIDMISIGNHETAVLKHHYTEPIARLIERLHTVRDDGLNPIVHGGYRRFLVLRFTLRPGVTRRYVIYTFHGTGGSAEVTQGEIPLNRLSGWINADLLWMAHLHVRKAGEAKPIHYVDGKSGVEMEKQRKTCITGSYIYNLSTHDPNTTKSGAYRMDWTEERTKTPQAMGGGIPLHIHVDKDGIEGRLSI